MTRDETIEYAKIVWWRMAETGQEKYDAIEDLIEEGVLPENALEWPFLCPFCNEYEADACISCPWPGTDYMRCTDDGSQFDDWSLAKNKEEDKKYSKAVYDLICTMS
jgi:hypothetical protein